MGRCRSSGVRVRRPGRMICALLALAFPRVGAAGRGDNDDPLFDDPEPPQASVRRAGAFGLGIGAGTSTAGLSAKYWANELWAVQAVVGAGYRRAPQGPVSPSTQAGSGASSSLALGVDLLYEQPSFAAFNQVELGWSLGPGVGAWFGTDSAVALAFVVGLEVCVTTLPVDLVIEYRPRVDVLPDPAIQWVAASGHLRWYF